MFVASFPFNQLSLFLSVANVINCKSDPLAPIAHPQSHYSLPSTSSTPPPPHSGLSSLHQSSLSFLLRSQKISISLLSLLFDPVIRPLSPRPLLLSAAGYALARAGLGSIERKEWQKAKGEFELGRNVYKVLGYGTASGELESEQEREAYRARVKGEFLCVVGCPGSMKCLIQSEHNLRYFVTMIRSVATYQILRLHVVEVTFVDARAIYEHKLPVPLSLHHSPLPNIRINR